MKRSLITLISIVSVATAFAEPEEASSADLAAAAQNPLASMISLPFQNNTTFDMDPGDETLNVLNIQPVWPFKVSKDWNLITRTIIPIVSQPDFPNSNREGIGDTSVTGWLSPTKPINNWTVGVGPVLSIPTATRSSLGADQFGGGVSAVGVYIKKPWVAGALVNNVWGMENTDNLNTFLFQYFVNYNLPKGWYLVTAPVITADWNARSGQKWIVPFGGGVGKLIKVGNLPINANAQVYRNVEKPSNYGDWSLRLQLQFMFPK